MDLEQKAIERIKTASEMSLEYYKQPLICTYSGGKDSDVLLELFKRSGVPFEAENIKMLDKACEKALKQIKEKHYDQKLEKEGYETILNYGIACYKKRCKVLVDK